MEGRRRCVLGHVPPKEGRERALLLTPRPGRPPDEEEGRRGGQDVSREPSDRAPFTRTLAGSEARVGEDHRGRTRPGHPSPLPHLAFGHGSLLPSDSPTPSPHPRLRPPPTSAV